MMMIFETPSASSTSTARLTPIPPTGACPPVMATAELPSSVLVEVLCGQSEQKYGARRRSGSRRLASGRAWRGSGVTGTPLASSLRRSRGTIASTSSSP
ncbi:hypothetical protein OUY22_08420 [Nonomuraea sp. MCN248]|uniref:Uncharacterized protein n=1 Tax=Nonomuraea corallina TaxID=2989783 RepID=A0ABT4S8D9_9ACTN|nr:hypothetical protein [Nonomuraea corallina]MDA0633441.1 hypothetical protein [Nonomuraea corallina]